MINLVYWSENNFGDALSPLLVEELSGEKTRLKGAYIKKLRRLVKGIIYISPKIISAILFPWQSNVLGVGSIITCGNARSKVWGSGFMNSDGKFNGGEIFAVRGPHTAERLVEQGYQKCSVFGDPALLLPLWLNPAKNRQHKLGIVPHWKETEEFISKYGKDYKVIDLRTKDIERVVEQITSCEYILSTSLHGIIVAHAYNIPSLWIQRGYIETDGFKFADYFSSVGIDPYKGFENIDEILKSEQGWVKLFKSHAGQSVSQVSLREMQIKLLGAAPFPLKEKYQRLTKEMDVLNELKPDKI